MKRTTRSIAITWLTCLSLVLSLCAGILFNDRANAQSSAGSGSEAKSERQRSSKERKFSGDLEERLNRASSRSNSATATQTVILELNEANANEPLAQKIQRLNGRIKKVHGSLGLATVELPVSSIRALQYDNDVTYVSQDQPLKASGFLEDPTGAEQVRSMASGSGLIGTGVGIAILDSGIDITHNALKPAANHPGVVFSKDFTGQGTTADKYGHGTHVATMIGGADTFASGDYTGIAPGASLLNLRVLDNNGQGNASNIITAIDWCITNKATYNIRIINMSLGGTAKDSYLNDPLCKSVRRAFNAGIIVVCAAGNDGKGASGQKYYGGIHTPGIEPAAITVGASNTFNTQQRSDDTVTSFSSRGPTRGYYVDTYGLKHFDNLIKPDVVAPGNKLIGACSVASKQSATGLINKYPALNPGTTSIAANQLLRMSGSSMSTGVVSGTAALLLQANSTLTPNLVKALMMYTAQPLAGANNFEQGAGQLNIDGAVRVAKLVKSNPSTLANGAALLTGSLPSSQTSTIFGTTFAWGQGVITDYCFLYGSNLMTKWQGAYAQGVLLSDATGVSYFSLTQNTSLVSTGVQNSSGSLQSTGVLLSDGVLVSDGVLLSSGVLLGDGVLIADGVLVSDGVLIADGVLVGDFDPNGDNTPGMPYSAP